ncbi:MAG: HlyC/CorC family transporter [Chloroflexi bacterium]|nr:HlyC/CorC family transporter [Ardenticatenaceae bacterium]MBL1129547.1 HlyC/CorC family transporter [Chloroflexota bacterium]NOG35629.1 HlyC/CorC family transporter [Chloroflexota bacterium]GIK58486.1 MAG: transporter [Chloroflexota bacterium]
MSELFFLLLTVPAVSVMTTAVRTQAAESEAGFSFLLSTIVLIMLFVLLNGIYVAAEFSIIGVRPTQMEQMVDEGHGRARAVLAILESRPKQDQYIATAQLGITIASLALAMVGEPRIAHLIEPYLAAWGLAPEAIHTVSYFIALGLLTYLHVVLGEMVPKSLALTDAPKMVLLLATPMRLSSLVLKYPVHSLNRVGLWLLRLFRIPPAEGHARVSSPEEIELIVTESAEGGLLNEDEQEMILNIFEFSERTVGQVMTPRTKVQAIPHDVTRDNLFKIVTESRHSRFPVYVKDRDHIIGILHLKDLIRQTLDAPGRFNLRSLLRAAPAVPEDLPVETLLAAFKRQRLHMAIVLDEFGGMAGVVTLEDLVEEVVGEVRDEFDLEKEPYVEIGPGVLEVAGHYLVDDFDEGFWGDEEDLPDVETVGGLLVTKLGRPPQVGDEVIYNDTVHLKVLAVDGRAVSRIRIEFPIPG